MRTPWLLALFVFLLPITLICLNLSSESGWIGSSSSLAIWTTILIALLGTVAFLFLVRLTNWHPRNRDRQ
jgi:hypothetical protein